MKEEVEVLVAYQKVATVQPNFIKALAIMIIRSLHSIDQLYLHSLKFIHLLLEHIRFAGSL